jgi:RES domain-containing protein
MTSYCCPCCFGDRGLRKDIFPTLSPDKGACDFCDTKATEIVEPRQLATYFELLSNIYEPNSEGRPLVEWMVDDWALFSSFSADMALANKLLGEILDNANIADTRFVPSLGYSSEGLLQWDSLRAEMMYRNRWFLGVPLDTDRLEDLLVHLPADALPTSWYRARLIRGDTVYPIGEMGVPPKRDVTHGRANPAGIPYLYLSSLPETAVSEVRPHTGERACVADFDIDGPLCAVDLREPRKLVSPFLLSDASSISQLRADIPFLERLGDELTQPVLPSSAAIDYIPSQYLCEFIKKCGYDGVVYRSSVSEGINLAMFEPRRAVGKDVQIYVIKRVSVCVEQA